MLTIEQILNCMLVVQTVLVLLCVVSYVELVLIEDVLRKILYELKRK